ncbi:MAG: pyridoxal phosphate-dependent aminotransferase, partial [Candidatus Thermoplasmatota archaeon]|nr:pyridoxal phosphate-dependent aminotransferase [Candidatus Thermoplasmatota archaeon]
MNIPSLGLFHWQETYARQAKYVLAYSNIPGISYRKYQALTRWAVPASFNLNKNDDRGASELREVLCSQYSFSDENVVTSTGGSEANFLVFLASLRAGDEVIVETPIYEPLYRIPELLGARTISWERRFDNRYQLELKSLEELITKKTRLVVLTNLHNPSGVCVRKSVFQRLGRLAEQYNFYVLVDEIFLEGMIPIQSSVFGIPRMIITSSMTKIYGVGGLRTGWIIAPQEVAEKCQLSKGYTTGCSSYLSEILSSHLLRNGKDQLLQEYYF